MSNRNLCFSFTLLAALALPALALDPGKSLTQYAHRIWGQEQGLFEPTVYSILQTRDGFLWLGTQDSLIRFDGIHFREYEDASGQPLFDHSLVRALLEDRRNNLWVATIGAGVARITPDGAVTRYRFSQTRAGATAIRTGRELPSDDAFCVATDPANNIWICTSRGLTRISQHATRTYTTADGLTSNQIRSTCVASDGTQWVAGLDFGLNRRSGDRFEPYSDALIRPRENVTSLLCSKNGPVWAGTSRGVFEISGGKSRPFTRIQGLSDDDVSTVSESQDGSIWIGAHDGITRYQNGRFSVYRTRDGLSHSLVLTLYADREGSLWAGTKDGLDQFTDGNVTPFTSNEGLLGNDAGPLLQDAAGRLWVASRGRGLNVFEAGELHHITSATGMLGNTVLSMALDPAGDVWVGTDRGLNRFHDATLAQTYTFSDRPSDREVRALVVANDGALWAGTSMALRRFDGTRFAPVRTHLPSAVVSLSHAPRLGLFVSVENAAFYSLQNDSFQAKSLGASHPVDCYLNDAAEQSVWMGTLGSGLLYWKNGVITHIRVKDGLYDNRIYSILRDDRGSLWFGSSKGIFRVAEQELIDFVHGGVHRVTSIPFSTGQLRFECSSGVQPEAYRARDGRLWFATNNGVVVIDPQHLMRNTVPPPVAVTAVVVNGRRIQGQSAVDLGLRSLERNVEIRYAGLSFVSPEKVAFRYILRGFDKSWTDAGDRREAFFTNLPPGHFQFLVSARNADGVWSTAPAAFSITVEPRLYQRAWFIALLAILFALLGFALYRRRIRRLRQTFNLVLAERTRIARELHDTLLQGISGITMQLQALWTRLPPSREKNTLREIINDAGRASREARQSLRGLRSDPRPGGFVNELTALAGTIIGRSQIELEIDADPLSLAGFPELEFQLLRIAREALTNCLKHSMASRIRVELRATDRQLRLSIEDNGVGFSSRTAGSDDGHFGIVGMRERALELGGEFYIRDRSPSGTIVGVELKLDSWRNRQGNLEPEMEHPFVTGPRT